MTAIGLELEQRMLSLHRLLSEQAGPSPQRIISRDDATLMQAMIAQRLGYRPLHLWERRHPSAGTTRQSTAGSTRAWGPS